MSNFRAIFWANILVDVIESDWLGKKQNETTHWGILLCINLLAILIFHSVELIL